MIDEEKQEQKELEVKLDEVNEDTEVEISTNPLDTLTERVENGELDDKLELKKKKNLKLKLKKHRNIPMICLIL
jgi:ppGpp synthetase/RelA/SpoT-type nucleotidyltranferase